MSRAFVCVCVTCSNGHLVTNQHGSYSITIDLLLWAGRADHKSTALSVGGSKLGCHNALDVEVLNERQVVGRDLVFHRVIII